MGLVLSGVVCCLGVCVCLGWGLRFGFDLLCACLMCVSVNSVGLFAAHFTWVIVVMLVLIWLNWSVVVCFLGWLGFAYCYIVCRLSAGWVLLLFVGLI